MDWCSSILYLRMKITKDSRPIHAYSSKEKAEEAIQPIVDRENLFRFNEAKLNSKQLGLSLVHIPANRPPHKIYLEKKNETLYFWCPRGKKS